MTTFAPTDLSNCTVWLDATQLDLDDDDPLGTSWPNLGSGSDGAIVGSPAPVVKTNSPYGLPVVRFTYMQGRVRGDGMVTTPSSDLTVVYVGRTWGSNVGRIFTNAYPPFNFLVGTHISANNCCYDGGWLNTGIGWSTPTPWTTWGFVNDAGADTFYVDGTASGTATSPGHDSKWNLSGYDATGDNESCDCEVAELICYDRALSSTERVQIETYLHDKWFSPPPVPVASGFHSTGQLDVSITATIITEPPPGGGGGGGGWTTDPNPPLPTRQDGPSWTTTALLPTQQHGPGWFALIEKVGRLTATGALSATVATNYPNASGALAGTGTLAATIAPIKAIPAAFTGIGTTTATVGPIKAVTANFTANTSFDTPINEGLWVAIDGGVPLTDGLSAIISGGLFDGLSANIVAVQIVAVSATYSSTGTLTAVGFSSTGAPAFFATTGDLAASASPVYAVALTLSSSGTLAASATPVYAAAAALSGSGTLTATVVQVLSTAAALSASGSLTATAFGSTDTSAALTGSGLLSAIIAPIHAITAALTGTGTLSATGRESYSSTTALAATGTLSASVRESYPSTAALVSTGTLSAIVVQRSSTSPAFSGAGTLSAIVVQQFSTSPALSGAGTLTATGIQQQQITAGFGDA